MRTSESALQSKISKNRFFLSNPELDPDSKPYLSSQTLGDFLSLY